MTDVCTYTSTNWFIREGKTTYSECVGELMRNSAFVLIMGMFSLYTASRHKVQVSGSLKPRLLYPSRESRRYPLNRRLGEPQRRSGRFGGYKPPASAGNRTPDRSASSQVSTSTTKAHFLTTVPKSNCMQ
jgi:hypothetical protein